MSRLSEVTIRPAISPKRAESACLPFIGTGSGAFGIDFQWFGGEKMIARGGLFSPFRAPSHGVELGVRPHVGEVGHPVGEGEEGAHRRDVPDILVAEAV